MPMRGEFREGGRRRRCWRPIEIIAMVLGFIVFWPIGLAILFWKVAFKGRLPERFEQRYTAQTGFPFAWPTREGEVLHHSTGNAAFEDYKTAELARLEEERRKLMEAQKDFASFMDELKRAKDREEFDRFMAARAAKNTNPEAPSA
jgi:hypothetical protein